MRFEGSDLEATAFAIADNRTHEFATWDDTALSSILQSLREEDALEGVGYSSHDIDALIDQLQAEAGGTCDADLDAIPEPPDEPTTRSGDLWTSFARRHEYVAVVVDVERGDVAHVADGRGKESLAGFFRELTPAQRDAIEIVAMDMWEPFIRTTQDWLPRARIVFDKFHVAQHLGDAVDRVRRQEHRELLQQGDRRLPLPRTGSGTGAP